MKKVKELKKEIVEKLVDISKISHAYGMNNQAGEISRLDAIEIIDEIFRKYKIKEYAIGQDEEN